MSENNKGQKGTLRTPSMPGTCSAGRAELYITSDGLVYPCLGLAFPEFLIGDAKKESVEKIWKSSKLLKKLRKLTVDDFEKCKKCKYKYSCGGGCRGTAYFDFKSLKAPDLFHCQYMKL
jgi:radical SAM protein with 4Fe4S-binding SPASM domain